MSDYLVETIPFWSDPSKSIQLEFREGLFCQDDMDRQGYTLDNPFNDWAKGIDDAFDFFNGSTIWSNGQTYILDICGSNNVAFVVCFGAKELMEAIDALLSINLKLCQLNEALSTKA